MQVFVTQSIPRPEVDLTRYKGKNPLLMIFAPSADDIRYQETSTELERNLKTIRENDLLLFRIFEWGENWQGDSRMDIGLAAALRDRYGVYVPGQFLVVLIGRDGSLRFRSDAEVPVGEILCRIDSSPHGG